METCGKCNEKTKFAWNIDNTLYCKRCHPTTIKLNELPRSKLRGIEKQQGSYTPIKHRGIP